MVLTATAAAAPIACTLAVTHTKFRGAQGWSIAEATVLAGPDALRGRHITVTGAFPPHTAATGFAGAVVAEQHPRFGTQYKLVRIDAPAPPSDSAPPTDPHSAFRPPPSEDDALRLTVQIAAIRAQREDSGWIAASAQVLEGPPALVHTLISISGVLPTLYPGCAVEIAARAEDHPTYGRQYRVLHALPRLPFDEAGMRTYLQGAFKDVGPKRSEAIWHAFGMTTPEVLDGPDAVARLAAKPQPDIAAGWGEKIVTQWQRQSAERAALLTLASAGLSLPQCLRVARHFGSETGAVLVADPYRLLEVDGIGFRVADSVALRTGIAPDDPRRLEAGLLEAGLEAARRGGHCWSAVEAATADAAALLGQDPAAFAPVLAAPRGLVSREGATIWPAPLLRAEQTLARALGELRAAPMAVTARLTPAAWASVLAAQVNVAGAPITLSAEQEQAVRFLVEEAPVGILTGGPGVGKTQTLRAVLAAYRAAGIGHVRLCAPTGKAAKRMTETTGRPSTTIHRLLASAGLAAAGAGTDPAEATVDAAVVVVDEASMLDLPLAARLVGALRPGTRLLLIGDTAQLPSVGPGRVLGDLLDAGLPAVRLTQVFRQAAASRIIQAAYAIHAGTAPALLPVWGAALDPAAGDAVLVEAPTAREVARAAVALVRDLIPAGYGIAPADIRVLVPVYKGECGIHVLNAALQAALNPPRPGLPELPWGDVDAGDGRRLKRTLRQGDRLLWLTNDPQTGLVNGSEVGVEAITGDAASGHQVLVRSLDGDPEGPIALRLGAVDAIHGYAMSVHKSQGSEYPAVVMVCAAEHAFTSRRLLYTGVTRAKGRLVVLGTADALLRAVARNRDETRRTGLVARLAGALPAPAVAA